MKVKIEMSRTKGGKIGEKGGETKEDGLKLFLLTLQIKEKRTFVQYFFTV